MRIFFRLLLLTLCCLGVGKGLYYLRDGFSLRKIYCSAPYGEETAFYFSEPFHYLGRGRQCFAFISQDGQTVLKFPRTDIHRIHFWTRALAFSIYREKQQRKCLQRKRLMLESLRIAFQELSSQTGVTALHFGGKSDQTLHLIDAMGYSHFIPLRSTCFVLQKKQSSWTQAFLVALHAGDRKEAERILDAFVQIVIERGRLGILNRDRSFLRNYGFDGQKAYQIDVGSFFYAEGMERHAAFQKSVRDSMDPVQEWLAKMDPQMLQFLNKKIEISLQ